MNFNLHRIRKRVIAHTTRLTSFAVAVAAVVALGLSSSWYMVEAGFSLTTRQIGPWVMWTSTAKVDADPYTRAHFARSGALMLSADIADSYLARTDGEGLKLHSSCDYVVEGQAPAAAWWSLSVFDEQGRLIPNPIARHAFTSDTVAIGAKGEVSVSLARNARPGNWLPTGGAGRLALLLVLVEPRPQQGEDGVATLALPQIRKVQCR